MTGTCGPGGTRRGRVIVGRSRATVAPDQGGGEMSSITEGRPGTRAGWERVTERPTARIVEGPIVPAGLAVMTLLRPGHRAAVSR